MIARMFHVILFQPAIPPNTGNLIRLCANVGAALHLVHPLGFAMEDRHLRRAGLDYHELTCVREHASLAECLAAIAPRPLFSNSPVNDDNFAVAGVRKAEPRVREVYALLGAEKNLVIRTPDCAHDFPDDEREAAYELLDEALGHESQKPME